jgi:hypothetical protein
MLQPYLRRGLSVSVHFEENKRWLWEALQIQWTKLDGAYYHSFPYHEGFNGPTHIDGTGSKIAANFTLPLPDIGLTQEELWNEMCEQDMSDRLYPSIRPAVQATVDKFLQGCCEPLVLLHTHGSNMQFGKNIPDEDVLRLYDGLLSNMPGTVVCLDWDNRIPFLRDGRMRHTLHDFHHMSIEETAALYRRAALLIGIDSGPYHLSYFTPLPALGVFHHHYPACITLPRTRSAVMTRSSEDYRVCNRPRRSRWSILEYPGVYPPVEDILRHSLRMLDGLRYLDNPRMRGRDVLLQQLARDWQQQGTPLNARAYRNGTYDYVLRQLRDFPAPGPVIVETGCQRSLDDWGAGGSTTIYSAVLHGLGRGSLDSVDLSPDNIATAQRLTISHQWQQRVQFHVQDSVQYLQTRQESIDVLYLDALDADQPGHAEHCLAEFQAAQRLLHKRSIVIIDDCFYAAGWVGKGRLTVPFALDTGWQVVAAGYQVVLRRNL